MRFITSKGTKKRKELEKLLMEEKEVHCLDLDSYIAMLTLALRLSYKSKTVKAKVIKAFEDAKSQATPA